MRNLASVVVINNVIKHPNADSLDICTIGGWKVVSKLNEFVKGNLAVYFEIDSWIPRHIAPWLCKETEKFYEGIDGARLRTVRLRGELSQGLLMPVSIISDSSLIFEGSDVTEFLGIKKYEKPLPVCLTGIAKGLFPSFIPKTDLTRIQSLTKEFAEWKSMDYTWTIEEKVDGSSTTVFFDDDGLNVCSRNLNVKESENNSYWNMALKYNLREKLDGLRYAIQFETAGPGINGSLYKQVPMDAYAFDVYDIELGQYLSPAHRNEILRQLEMNIVPIIERNYKFPDNITIDVLLTMADGKSIINSDVYREGLVFRCEQNPSVRFKVISNKFLLKYDN